MDAKRCWAVVILLTATLALTGCAGNSAEVEAAKAEYIRAKAHLIEAEAQEKEQEIVLLQQQRELARTNAELAAELRRQRQQALIEIGQVVIPGGLGVGSLLALLHALRPLIRTWTEQRVRLLKHKRDVLEAQARAEAEQQATLRLQIELTQAQARLTRERRWLEHTRRAHGVPLEHEIAGGNGRGH